MGGMIEKALKARERWRDSVREGLGTEQARKRERELWEDWVRAREDAREEAATERMTLEVELDDLSANGWRHDHQLSLRYAGLQSRLLVVKSLLRGGV